jgi:hypothetical protein
MSRLSVKGKGLAPLAQIADNLRNAITQRGQDFASGDHTRGVLSLEKLDEATFKAVQHHSDQLQADIKGMFGDAYGASVDLQSFTAAQWEAGAITAMAAGDVTAFHRAANTQIQSVSTENLRVIEPTTVGIHGDAGYSDKSISLEAFDERELKAHMAYSIAFNVNAARQDEFGEAFYPTVVVSPDQAGLDVTVRRAMVMQEIRHAITGKAMDFKRINLVDAVVEPTILATDSTVLVPVRLTSGADQVENNANFAAGTNYQRTLADGTVVDTGALVPNVDIDMLGIGMRTDLATQGVYDVTDSLDSRLYLENLYLTVTGAGTGASDPGSSIIKFDVSRLPRNAWIKSTEGTDRDTYLQFTTVDLPVNKDTKDISGVVASVSGGGLNWLLQAGYTDVFVRFGIQLSGSANHEVGNVRVNGATVTVEGAFHKNVSTGVVTPVSSIELAAIKTDITAAFLGFEAYAARTNLNRRTRGLQITTLEITERYTIPLLSPITAPAPISSNRDASDLTTLITTARIRNSNLAVTQLLNYGDTLASFALSQDRLLPVPTIEGIGRLLVRPYYFTDTIDAQNVTASVKSQDRAADVSAAIINAIRDAVYKMHNESGYQAAADALSGVAGEKPLVLIGTDAYTARHININGDTRLLGHHFDARVVTSLDKRVKGKIFVTFVRPNQQGVDPLSFGVMAWMPELAGTIQLTRNGATIKETMVQPRVRHINFLPLLIKLDVTNLAEAIADQLPIRMDNIEVP